MPGASRSSLCILDTVVIKHVPRYAAAEVLRDAVVNVRFQAVENRQESFLV